MNSVAAAATDSLGSATESPITIANWATNSAIRTPG